MTRMTIEHTTVGTIIVDTLSLVVESLATSTTSGGHPTFPQLFLSDKISRSVAWYVRNVTLFKFCKLWEWKSRRVVEYKSGRVEEWKSGRVEVCMIGRVQYWKSVRSVWDWKSVRLEACEIGGWDWKSARLKESKIGRLWECVNVWF